MKIGWAFSVILTILLGVIFMNIIDLTISDYKTMVITFLVIDLICFAFFMKLIPGGFNQASQAVCHMGRLKTKSGEKNIKAMIFFILYGIFEAILVLILGN